MEKVDIVIIGAGVVGLAIASKLARKNRALYVIERHDSFGRETSSRNSEVIHAGIYYPQGSLKARLCVEGNRLLYDICEKYNIPHKRIGKFIVATNNIEEGELQKLFEKGSNNGVKDLRLISKGELEKFEPNVKAKCALYSQNTGIIDTHSLMKYFEKAAKELNTEIVYNCEVAGLDKLPDGYAVTTKDASGEIFKFKTKIIINSAGLNSDIIARMAGIDIEKENYRLKYCKGQYFRINSSQKCNLINRLIYPVPHEKITGLGVHATKDLQSSLRLGPDTHYVDRNNFNYDVNIADKEKFLEAALKFLPFLKAEDLIADTTGIRPKLQGEEEDFRDFVIKEESCLGFSGFINLIGIESPGLTSCPAIAKHVEELVKPLLS